MSIIKTISLGTALSGSLVAAAHGQEHIVTDGGVDAFWAGLPIAPSILFFAAGIVGLAILSRRKARRTTSPH